MAVQILATDERPEAVVEVDPGETRDAMGDENLVEEPPATSRVNI